MYDRNDLIKPSRNGQGGQMNSKRSEELTCMYLLIALLTCDYPGRIKWLSTILVFIKQVGKH